MNILNQLTIRHLKLNKKRTIVTIIGVILSTALMVGIGLLLSTFREFSIEDIKQNTGEYHAEITNVDRKDLTYITNNITIKKNVSRGYIGYAKISESILDKYYKVYGTNKEYMKHLPIQTGRIPKNNKEVIVSNYLQQLKSLKVGDTLKLNIGDRYIGNKAIADKEEYIEGEYIKQNNYQEYKIVGIFEHDSYESFEIGNYIYTIETNKERTRDVFITYKKAKDTYKNTEKIQKILNQDSREITYNVSLLSMYGVSSYNNMITGLAGMLIIMLSLVSVACIIVIYNSFAISVMERKKQFGLFSSIGATKKQIRKTVLYEAKIIAAIGIPLGILSAYLGIGIVITLVNYLLKDILSYKLHLVTYPLFILIPIVFMILTILISAFLPAKRASKISPIEAIRLNDDIKIKKKKVKSPKWVGKLFGIEGDLAYKNMKRNKKKYRITVVSLFISVVLFISFSGYMKYALVGMQSYTNVPDLDITISINEEESDKAIVNQFINHKDVKEYALVKTNNNFFAKETLDSMYSKKYKKFLKQTNGKASDALILVLDDASYKRYLKKINKKTEKPILYNLINQIVYTKNSRKAYYFNKYDKKAKKQTIQLKEYTGQEEEEQKVTIQDYYVTDEAFLGTDLYGDTNGPIVIMNTSLAKKYKINIEQNHSSMLYLHTSNYKNIDKMADDYTKAGKLQGLDYYNVREQMRLANNIFLAVKILVYGFITLVTLIGVTSVFNTINTSIALRRKEFAVLRSVGLTPKGFNKTLRFESLLFGVKSLIYGIPVSLGIIYLMSRAMGRLVEFNTILIPWESIGLAIIGVFIIVAISMSYATRKIKKENILEAIREENI